MRITYRKNDSLAYWTQRWADVEADEPMENRASYPLKYALEAVARSSAPRGGRICEAGCGNGRLVRYFMRSGCNIRGFDFIPEAISKIKSVEPDAEVETGDILNLSYPVNPAAYIISIFVFCKDKRRIYGVPCLNRSFKRRARHAFAKPHFPSVPRKRRVVCRHGFIIHKILKCFFIRHIIGLIRRHIVLQQCAQISYILHPKPYVGTVCGISAGC